MAVSIISPQFYGWDSNGNPLSGGKVHTYITGTSTPKPSYTTESGTVENANPVILNANGYAPIHLSGSYKIVLTDSDDVEVWSADPVTDPTQLNQEWIHELDATFVSGTSFSVNGFWTDTYTVGRAVRVQQDGGFITGFITSVTYSVGVTTVVFDPLSGSLDATVSKSWVSVVSSESFAGIGPNDIATAALYVEYDNVTEMKAATIPAGARVKLTRYDVVGDVVEGLEYEVMTAAAYGATPDGYVDHYVSGTSNVAVLLHPTSEIHLDQCGARSAADCNANVAAALAQVGTYATIYFGAYNTYTMSPLSIGIANKGCTFVGHVDNVNNLTSRIETNSSTGILFDVNATQLNFKNLALVGSSDSTLKGSDTSDTAIRFRETATGQGHLDCIVDNCWFIWWNRALDIQGRNSLTRNCVFGSCNNVMRVDGYGGITQWGHIVKDCRMHSCIVDANLLTSALISIEASGLIHGMTVENIHVDDCGLIVSGFAGDFMIDGINASRQRGPLIYLVDTGSTLVNRTRNAYVRNVQSNNSAVSVTTVAAIRLVGQSDTRYGIADVTVDTYGGVGLLIQSDYTHVKGLTLHNMSAATVDGGVAINVDAANCRLDNVRVTHDIVNIAGIVSKGYNVTSNGEGTLFNDCYTVGLSGREYAIDTSVTVGGTLPIEESAVPRVMYGTAAPTTGTYNINDMVIYTNPSAGGAEGVKCIVAGVTNPSNWKEFGSIAT